ncbi:hypothetical protein NDU88_006502 [Pleurodeles waltl]|uniref:Uncharacterized protein n=1 Tax=Pleurodeles waltl TaxID=8319 RepID=A0AAV7MFX5_PLEWA|nr:hypothetical protein NDU88_006502 [Pleurodeles waltl]
MVARAAPREQEELLKDALSRTVKTPRVRRETVERLALRGICRYFVARPKSYLATNKAFTVGRHGSVGCLRVAKQINYLSKGAN